MKGFTALLLTGLAGVALAGGGTSDRPFYQKAAAGGLAEVETGKLAQEKGKSEEVRNFGRMMVEDHTAANAKLSTIARIKEIDLPDAPSAKHQAMKKELAGLSGAAFDEVYVRSQIEDHEDTIALLKREIEHGNDPEAKRFAEETLPTVEAHLEKIKEIQDKVKVASADGKRGEKR